MNILIVDDNMENIDMMSILLESQNYKCQSAKNGQEALQKLHSNKFDLIISDILMPVMDGFQFCSECKKNDNLKNICFIFYTATYIDAKDEELALSLGANKFIRKPQEPEVFLSLINEIIEKSKNEKNKNVDDTLYNEKEVLKLYSERLVKKLEKKNFDLENEIAARKKIEKELIKAKEKAEESDRLKSAFLANISHEIRTPLNAIFGFSSLMAKNTDLQKKEKYLKYIKNGSSCLLKLINDILDVSRIEVNQLEVKADICRINSILYNLYTASEIILENENKKNIKIKLQCASVNDDYQINSDPVRVEQILFNLLDNAIKYTPDGGQIDIGYDFIYSENIKNNIKALKFYVKDTGIGIPNDKLDFIFKRFNKLEESTTQLYRGAGIGLTITKKIVNLLGGEIWVESTLGKGSQFYFTLPNYPVLHNEKEDVVENIKKINWQDKIILIAEDVDASYIYIKELLEETGVKLLHAKNGKEAVNYCKSNPKINIILMDIKMPVMDGYEAINIIKKLKPDIPIIAQTAYAMADDEQKVKNAGADDYLTKPIEETILISKINNLLHYNNLK